MRRETRPARTIEIGDLIFVRNHQHSDASLSCIKKMFELYVGPYVCMAKPSDKVVELLDPVTKLTLGRQSVEQCKIWRPSESTRNEWMRMVMDLVPGAKDIKLKME